MGFSAPPGDERHAAESDGEGMTRDDLKRFRALDINFDSIGLLQSGADDFAYFCTPIDAEFVGRIGCDGVHFILLPEDERVFCVDPSMGERGTYVLPVASDFREFLSFILYCQDANPLSQIFWMTRKQYEELAAEDAAARENEYQAKFFEQKDKSLALLVKEFNLTPIDPFKKVKAMQAKFDPAVLNFSEEYYDAVGYERPKEETVHEATFDAVAFTMEKEEAMLPQDPNILLSVVNTKLRDEYSSLDALCDGLDAVPAELTEKLGTLGYAYDPDTNQFKPV